MAAAVAASAGIWWGWAKAWFWNWGRKNDGWTCGWPWCICWWCAWTRLAAPRGDIAWGRAYSLRVLSAGVSGPRYGPPKPIPRAPCGPPTMADAPPMDGRRREWGIEWEREGWRWCAWERWTCGCWWCWGWGGWWETGLHEEEDEGSSMIEDEEGKKSEEPWRHTPAALTSFCCCRENRRKQSISSALLPSHSSDQFNLHQIH